MSLFPLAVWVSLAMVTGTRDVSFWYGPASYGGEDMDAVVSLMANHSNTVKSVMICKVFVFVVALVVSCPPCAPRSHTTRAPVHLNATPTLRVAALHHPPAPPTKTVGTASVPAGRLPTMLRTRPCALAPAGLAAAPD